MSKTYDSREVAEILKATQVPKGFEDLPLMVEKLKVVGIWFSMEYGETSAAFGVYLRGLEADLEVDGYGETFEQAWKQAVESFVVDLDDWPEGVWYSEE